MEISITQTLLVILSGTMMCDRGGCYYIVLLLGILSLLVRCEEHGGNYNGECKVLDDQTLCLYYILYHVM